MINSYLNKNKFNNIIIIFSFLILSGLSILFLYHTHILLGASDMPFHARRIMEWKESILHGNLLPRFSLNEFNGSPVMTTYPYMNLIPELLLSFVIKSGIKLIYASFVVNVFIAYIISYYSSIKYTHDVVLSYLFSIFYCTSTYYLDYGFLNMDLGMLSVITVLPLVLFGVFSLLRYNKWLELSFGMSLIVFSHILSIFIISAFILVILLINFSYINVKKIKNLCKAALLTICITSIFWVPFVHLILLNFGNINRPGSGLLKGTSFSSTLFGAIFGKGTYSISIIPIIGLILSFLLFKYLTKLEKQMLILSTFIIIICSKLIPWGLTSRGIFKAFKIFQFTWRFYIIPQLLLCYLCAVSLKNIISKISSKSIRQLILLILIIVPILFQFEGQIRIVNNNISSHDLTRRFISQSTTSSKSPQYIHHKLVHFNNIYLPFSKNVKQPPFYRVSNQSQYYNLISPYIILGGFDYYPMTSLPKFNAVVNNYATTTNGHIIPVKRIFYNKLEFNSKKSYKKLFLPIVKYRGENINIRVNDNLQKPLKNKYNLLMVKNIKKGQNHIKVNIVNNNLETFIEVILTSVGIYMLLIYNKNKIFIKYRKSNI